jgi:hypothetical protein
MQYKPKREAQGATNSRTIIDFFPFFGEYQTIQHDGIEGEKVSDQPIG